MDTKSDSRFIRKGPCSICGSSDAFATYTDGHGFCFSCNTHVAAPDDTKRNKYTMKETQQLAIKESQQKADTAAAVVRANFVEGECKELPARKITLETCKLWGYKIGTYRGETVHVANYLDDIGNPVFQKIRFANKSFVAIGDISKGGLYGQHLWRNGGKMVVVTEGEIDALSVSQAQSNKWPVVSIPNGAAGSLRAIQRSFEYLDGFETVVLMFDNDEPGRKAANECAALFQPGKCKIAQLPLKDANDMLVAGRDREIIDAIWNAKAYRPDGIVFGEMLWEDLIRIDDTESVDYPYFGLQKMLSCGMRRGELVTLTAGTGVGKSTVCRELAFHLVNSGKKVGYIALEESVKRTVQGMLGVAMEKPLHLMKPTEIDQSELRASFDKYIGSEKIVFFDHFGSLDVDHLVAKVRYMAKGLNCKYIFLDNISMLMAGDESSNERKQIDMCVVKLRSLVQETNIGLFLVSHLKRVEGQSHEEGGQVSLSQIRGSGAIAMFSDVIIGLERNQQDPSNRMNMQVRVLKSRLVGDSGVATTLAYNSVRNRLTEVMMYPKLDPTEGNNPF